MLCQNMHSLPELDTPSSSISSVVLIIILKIVHNIMYNFDCVDEPWRRGPCRNGKAK